MLFCLFHSPCRLSFIGGSTLLADDLFLYHELIPNRVRILFSQSGQNFIFLIRSEFNFPERAIF
jgi:hypothetical protein